MAPPRSPFRLPTCLVRARLPTYVTPMMHFDEQNVNLDNVASECCVEQQGALFRKDISQLLLSCRNSSSVSKPGKWPTFMMVKCTALDWLAFFPSPSFTNTCFEGCRKELEVAEGTKVLVSKIQGQLYATGAKCTHFGAPLAKGSFL